MKNDQKNLNEECLCIGWTCDVLLPDGTAIKNMEAVEVENSEDFISEVGFRKYLEVTHFRRSE